MTEIVRNLAPGIDMIARTEDVEIFAPMDQWSQIRDDPRFVELMRLARAANSLGIAFQPLTHTLEDQSPEARRNRFAAFMYAAALLKEGLDTAQSLGRWFRNLPQYKEGFAMILSDPSFQELYATLLDKVRDKLVFHFDRDALVAGFRRFPEGGDVRLASFPRSGPKFGETYFDGADDAVLTFLFDSATTDEEYFAQVEYFMGQVSDLLKRFMGASHRLIAIGLLELGCKKKPMERQEGYPGDAV